MTSVGHAKAKINGDLISLRGVLHFSLRIAVQLLPHCDFKSTLRCHFIEQRIS